MSEQILRISSLQTRLDEQRHRAEELHRQGTSDLNLRVYDLQTQLTNTQEKLTAREKQIVTLKDHLEQSKSIIDRLESDLTAADAANSVAAAAGDGDRTPRVDVLEAQVREQTVEIQKLKEKIRSEMINKIALPDLMETMLSEKNEEIDHLKEQLAAAKQNDDSGGGRQAVIDWQLKMSHKLDGTTEGKLSARTLSDIVSLTDYDDEPDIIRKAAAVEMESVAKIELSSKFFAQSIEPSPSTLPPHPRQINFSIPDESDRPSGTPVKSCGAVEELPSISAALTTNDAEERCNALQQQWETMSVELTAQQNMAANLKLDVAAKTKLMADMVADKKLLQSELYDVKLTLSKFQVVQSEVKSLQADLELKQQDYNDLRRRFDDKSNEVDGLQRRITEIKQDLELATHQVQSLQKTLAHKDELLSKHEKNSLNSAQSEQRQLERINSLEVEVADHKRTIERISSKPDTTVAMLKQQLNETKANLFEVMIDYEKSQLDLKQSEALRSPFTYRAEADQRCQKLEKECEILREALLRQAENAAATEISSKPFDDIAECVEKELNYSAQLDSNILKAIESGDEINSDEDNLAERLTQPATNENELVGEVQTLRTALEIERNQSQRLTQQLTTAKLSSTALHEQDANVIAAMRSRLEAAMEQDHELQQQLDDERAKCERLTTQLLVHQRSLSRENSLLMLTNPSAPDSPRRQQRIGEAEAELVKRLQSEVKLMAAQIDREKERVQDMERVMEREKHRVDKELHDRRDYGERMRSELDRVLVEREQMANDLEHAQERLSLSSREIETLEQRISALQEAESRRASRRGRERTEFTQTAVDVQELRLKLVTCERERDALAEKVTVLRSDVERGAMREAQLTQALVKEHQGDGIVPQQFLQKLTSIVDNTKEYRRMAETLQFLTEERHALQQRVDELELRNRAFNRDELEKRVRPDFRLFYLFL